MSSRSGPSISIVPASGSSRPRIHFSNTDLPDPEPPITTIEVPGGTSRSTPSSTTLSPNLFASPRSRILGTVVLIGRRSFAPYSLREEHLGQHVIERQD